METTAICSSYPIVKKSAREKYNSNGKKGKGVRE
jgi:hypothetical protein